MEIRGLAGRRERRRVRGLRNLRGGIYGRGVGLQIRVRLDLSDQVRRAVTHERNPSAERSPPVPRDSEQSRSTGGNIPRARVGASNAVMQSR